MKRERNGKGSEKEAASWSTKNTRMSIITYRSHHNNPVKCYAWWWKYYKEILFHFFSTQVETQGEKSKWLSKRNKANNSTLAMLQTLPHYSIHSCLPPQIAFGNLFLPPKLHHCTQSKDENSIECDSKQNGDQIKLCKPINTIEFSELEMVKLNVHPGCLRFSSFMLRGPFSRIKPMN